MKLKYYMRGLGIGIAVTAVILSVSAKGKTQTMTDAQIIAKAKELGMTEQTVLSELEPEEETENGNAGNTQENIQENTQENTQNTKDTDGSEQEANAQNSDNTGIKPETDTKDSDLEEAVTGEDAAGPVEESAQVEMESTVIVSIYPGEGSYTVSRKLAALGLVESADVYDKFLCQNGYDKKLCTGNYEIKAGASADEIAGILTKRK